MNELAERVSKTSNIDEMEREVLFFGALVFDNGKYNDFVVDEIYFEMHDLAKDLSIKMVDPSATTEQKDGWRRGYYEKKAMAMAKVAEIEKDPNRRPKPFEEDSTPTPSIPMRDRIQYMNPTPAFIGGIAGISIYVIAFLIRFFWWTIPVYLVLSLK